MSVPERTEQGESRSSVEINRTAKGDAQFRVKLYLPGDYTAADFEALRQEAVQHYQELERELIGTGLTA